MRRGFFRELDRRVEVSSGRIQFGSRLQDIREQSAVALRPCQLLSLHQSIFGATELTPLNIDPGDRVPTRTHCALIAELLVGVEALTRVEQRRFEVPLLLTRGGKTLVEASDGP